MSPIQQIRNLPSTVKAAIAITGTILTLVTGVWAVDDRYVDQKEAVQTLEQYNMQVQQQISDQQKQFQMWELERLTEQYYQLKRLQRMYPDDTEIGQELNATQNRRDNLKEQLGLH